ncbi:MAG: GNAT family N-acetyltransferase [Gammaproteobacteria bacterium]|nr:GNAT family N-acetyltransferase [Gammaproteobacteria bacterium]NIR82845.1 GNAT family N-acetyltransferase [Gammaproteobacteria bacterium]NIR89954.1 GNAT family N-acetyltransferase [Gammaproteobacteria bacterium]NIU04003.1 GNAT family N-acetyltransferase [Gammaproteobacteria bacterium]NIV51323.1 GNAT family N-acetyltransferase [Gammaproteobacteria bacterium]
MTLRPPFRAARRGDAPELAELFAVCSGGVAQYVWESMRASFPGLTPLEIGARRYARDDIDFSYRNCVVAERDGRLAGLLLTFAVRERESDASASADIPEILRPYAALERPGTWYIGGLAARPQYAALGLGRRFLELAATQAQARGYAELSALVFEQNRKVLRLCRRGGFAVVGRRPVVPHPLIHYTGDVVLLSAPAARILTGRRGFTAHSRAPSRDADGVGAV